MERPMSEFLEKRREEEFKLARLKRLDDAVALVLRDAAEARAGATASRSASCAVAVTSIANEAHAPA